MKSRFRVALLSALMMTSPLLSFAGGEHVIRTPSKDEAQDRTGITRAVQYGKGTGMTRNQGVRANAPFVSSSPETNRFGRARDSAP